MLKLTEEQLAIVAHDLGPSLVFAVAGSGKTTATVYRIERLVRERVFNPKELLATSFSRLAVRDIRSKLEEWPHCGEVKVCTLHSLGHEILRLAQKRGHIDNLQLSEGDDDKLSRLTYTTLYRAVDEARRQDVAYADELGNFDHEDFLTYVGISKGNLRYADLVRANLPDLGLAVATQAEPPEPRKWYLPLYQLYEQIRFEHGWVTFDDMLMTGWEILVRFPDVLAEMRGRYQCVLVDEYQDVNLAQVEMLDQITHPHRNYMAIGDDDQTIYEWRGAHTRFILGFQDRYGAVKYFLSENFRSKAPHVALANKVISFNKRREPKHLVLTQGFDGATTVHLEDSDEQMGRNIVTEIQAALESGHSRDDIVVLVRLYAQTPYIEQFLIEQRIPYKVVGNSPFYQRSEVVTLINYLRLALIERELQSGKPLSDETLAVFTEIWPSVYNRPSRYIARAVGDQVVQAVSYQHAPISRALLVAKAGTKPRISESMTKLSTDLKWLASTMDSQAAADVLTELETRLEYTDFLKRTSGFPETGEGRAATVDAFIGYAVQKGTPQEFLQHLDYISFQRIGKNTEDETGLITLMTIFRAKGLQWPVVFVPRCNEGTIPFNPRTSERLEEERRLFYVAITRPRKELHLHILKSIPTSPFLREADCQKILHAVSQVRTALERDPDQWQDQDAVAVAKYTSEFHFDRYLANWWDSARDFKQKVVGKIQRFFRFLGGKDVDVGVNRDHARAWDKFGPSQEAPAEGEFRELEQLASKQKRPKPDVEKPRFTRTFPTQATEPARQQPPAPSGASSAAGRDARSAASIAMDAKGNPVRVGDRIRWSLYGEGTIRDIAVTAGTVEFLIEMDNGEVHVVDPKFVFPVSPPTQRNSVSPSRPGPPAVNGEQLF